MKEKLLLKLFELQNFFLKKKNFNKPKVFVYTDSRGYRFTGNSTKTPFGTYVSKLSFRYNLVYKICPESYTTIVDFIQYLKEITISEFDILILHCGVVDFSPRPLSNIEKVLASKAGNPVFRDLKQCNQLHYDNASDVLYNNEKTTSLYSEKYLLSYIIPQICKIQNLVWINSNHFVKGWDGNYKKGRPLNIDEIINKNDEIVSSHLANIISLKGWSKDEIMRYTIDNIHFSKAGFNSLYKKINNKIEELIKN